MHDLARHQLRHATLRRPQAAQSSLQRFTTHGNMPSKPDVKLAHCSVGCNQVAECLDWGAHGLIVYGAHNQAVIYDPEVTAAADVAS